MVEGSGRDNYDALLKEQLKERFNHYRDRLNLLSQAANRFIGRSGSSPYFNPIEPDRYSILPYGFCYRLDGFRGPSLWVEILRWLRKQ